LLLETVENESNKLQPNTRHRNTYFKKVNNGDNNTFQPITAITANVDAKYTQSFIFP
jgi:hypothetical protein